MLIVVRANFFLGWMSVQNIRMLYYDRIDISEGIDVNKTNVSRECHICHIGIS